MEGFYLNLKDKPRVVDFLVAAIPFADAKSRASAEKWVKAYQDGDHVPTDTLAEVARKLGIATWPARMVLQHDLSHEGAEEEWKLVTAAVRPSTAHLMKRFRASVRGKSLDDVLAHPEVETALHDEERMEIAGVRPSVREAIWNEKGSTLAAQVTAAKKELEGYQKRFASLRELATALPPALQDEVFSKIAHLEDKILFEGKIVPLETLDEEVKYYRDQTEIAPVDE